LPEEFVCAGCGTRSPLTAQFCHVCGLLLAPLTPVPAAPPAGWPAQPSPAGAPPAPVYGAPAVPATTTSARPTGITLLAGVELVTCLVVLFVVYDYGYWANWEFTYGSFGWGAVDALMAVGWAVIAGTAFMAASRLWSMQASAWRLAVGLAVGMISLMAVSTLLWSPSPSDFVGATAQLCVVGYLNLSHVRPLFGRRPLSFM